MSNVVAISCSITLLIYVFDLFVFIIQSNGHIPMSADLYQDRLARLESDKESLVLQVTFPVLIPCRTTMAISLPF